MPTVTLSPIEWAEIIRDAQAQALRGAALYFEREMAPAWGGDSRWLTTGTHVATLVRDVLRELEEEFTTSVSADREERQAHLDAREACHNGHPFEPGRTVDGGPGESHPDWCNVCGEGRA